MKENPNTLNDATKITLKSTKQYQEQNKIAQTNKSSEDGRNSPLIPILARLGALDTINADAGAIAEAVNEAKSVKQQLEEGKWHNCQMEYITVAGK